VKSRLLLDVVVRESASVLKLFSSEDETLLVWRNSFLVLNLGLDIFDRVTGLNLQGDGLASEGLDEDLHPSTKSEDKVKSRLLLDVVVGESATVLKLFSSEDEALLIWGNSFLVLDLSLDVLDGIAGLDLQGDGLARKSFNKDLHSALKVFLLKCYTQAV